MGPLSTRPKAQKSLSLTGPNLVWLIWGCFRQDPKLKSHYPSSWSGWYGAAFDQTQSSKVIILEGTFLNKTPTIQPFPKENPGEGLFLKPVNWRWKKVEALKRSAIVLEMLQNEKNTWIWIMGTNSRGFSGNSRAFFSKIIAICSRARVAKSWYLAVSPKFHQRLILNHGICRRNGISEAKPSQSIFLNKTLRNAPPGSLPDPKPNPKVIISHWAQLGLVDMGPLSTRPKAQKSLSLTGPNLVWLIWGRFRPDPKLKCHYLSLGPTWFGWYGAAFAQTQSSNFIISHLVWLIWGCFRPDPKLKCHYLSLGPTWFGWYGAAFAQTQAF